MKSIDIKSLLIGILGTALVMVLMGVTHSKSNYSVICPNMPSSECWIINTRTGVTKLLAYKYNTDGNLADSNWHNLSDTPDF